MDTCGLLINYMHCSRAKDNDNCTNDYSSSNDRIEADRQHVLNHDVI